MLNQFSGFFLILGGLMCLFGFGRLSDRNVTDYDRWRGRLQVGQWVMGVGILLLLLGFWGVTGR